MNEIIYTPEASQDLSEIKSYISNELMNPIAALRIISGITHRIETLIDHPQMGMVVMYTRNESAKNYRYLTCGNYIVFYRYEHKQIHIVRVLHGKQDYLRILFEEV